MGFLRLLRHLVVIIFLYITLAAFVFTMTRIRLPLPYSVLYWSYGMMAPYQGDTDWNAELVAEGELPDGSFEPISFEPYMPYSSAERNVRMFLRVYQYRGREGQREKFTEFALLLLDHERAKGKPYRSVRFFFDRWPRSTGGFSFLHQPLFTTRELITVVQ